MMDAARVIDFVNGTTGAELLPHQERIASTFLALDRGAKVRPAIRPSGKSRFTVPPALEAYYRGRSI